MARPESIAVGGYYPFPAHLVRDVAQLIGVGGFAQGGGTAAFVDPCAGEGAALFELLTTLFPSEVLKGNMSGTRTSKRMPTVQIYACEMEQTRHATLAQVAKQVLHWSSDTACLHGDMFRIVPDFTGGYGRGVLNGATVLWHNPPYDTDPVYGRLEHRFLLRAHTFQGPGGVLAHIVPHYALAASAALVAREYDQVSCYRLPEPEFSVFKQVVLLAAKRTAPLTLDVAQHPIAVAMRRWSDDAESIPVLPAFGAARPAVSIPSDPQGGFARWVLASLDLTALRGAVRPWTAGAATKARLTPGVGMDKGIDDLIGRVHPVAMPLKPGHIAQALAGGVMNGKRIAPDQPGRPPLLIKGVFEREYRTVDERTDKKTGEVTQLVQVQQPKLRVSVLDLDTSTYHDLLPGVEPTGAADLGQQTIADILVNYGQALAALIAEQCPALHDPANPDHAMTLPPLARAPFVAQGHAIQAGLKLLITGKNPFGLGEVGTGKSLISQAIAAALSPAHWATTQAEAARLGLPWSARLRPVRNVLVMCPPHLLRSWHNEVAATLPGAQVVVLESLSQVPRTRPAPSADPRPGAGMAFYVLSRETAKLGHGYAPGVCVSMRETTCPRCGAPVAAAGKDITEGRAMCGQVRRTPANAAARCAVDLAGLLATAATDTWLVETLSPRLVRRMAARAAQRRQDAADATHLGVEAAYRLRALGAAPGDLWESSLGRLCRQIAAMVAQQVSAKEPAAKHSMAILVRLLVSFVHEGRNALIVPLARQIYAATLADRSAYGVASDLRGWVRTLALLMDAGDAQDALVRELRAQHDGTGVGYSSEGSWVTTLTAIGGLHDERQGLALRFPNGWDSRDVKWIAGRLVWKVDHTHEHPVGDLHWAMDALRMLTELGDFARGPRCRERLYQAVPAPRRFPLATFIAKHRRKAFDLLILDEGHEYNNDGSAQERAAHRLVQMGIPTLVLSGSILSGYVSSMFANLLALSPAFASTFGRDGKAAFVTRYGYRKRLVELDKEEDAAPRRFGSQSDRVTDSADYTQARALGEAPGVLPLFLLDWLLPNAFVIHKADLDLELPPQREIPVRVPLGGSVGQALAGRYAGLQSAIVRKIGEDRWEPGLAGKLFGALGQAVTYLDRATQDTGNTPGARAWEARYPITAGGALVHAAELFPASVTLPKEAWLIERIAAERDDGRNCIVFVTNTGKETGLAHRLQNAINAHLGDIAVVLDSGKVSTKVRQEWITREVVGAGKQVLIVNPVAIKTGLNNLVPHFSTGIWYQDPHADAITYRQANGRLHRIGQTNPVRIYAPVYENTAQTLALDLLARKVSASLAVDGLDVASALDFAGAGEQDDALDVMEMGRAIYELLTGEQRALRAA